MGDLAQGMSSQQLRAARRGAVQFLYAVDLKQQFFFVESDFRAFCTQAEVPADQMSFVRVLVQGTLEDLPAIDASIGAAATNWRIERMGRVDLAILRVCSAELRLRPDFAMEVILADAAEIAREIGAEQSSSFVNGVLDKVARELRPAASR